MAAIRAARSNIRYHLAYIGWLMQQPELAGGRSAELCGPRGRGAALGRRLSGRCAVAGERRSEALVCEGEVAPLVPPAAGGPDSGHGAVGALRGSRFLSGPRFLNGTALKAAVLEAARREGFDAVAVTTPDAIPQAASRLRCVPRGGPPRRHGVDGRDGGAPRRSPAALWPEVRSIVMLGMSYAPQRRSARDAGHAATARPSPSTPVRATITTCSRAS